MDIRSRSAAIVEMRADGGPAVLVDAGPDIYRQLAALGRPRVEAIEAVILTHVHPDHYLGLVDLSAALPRPRVPLYHLDDNRRALEATFGYLFRKELVLRPMSFGAAFEAAGLTITPFDTCHFEGFSTAGLLVADAAGRRAAYAPDFKRTGHDLSGVDLLAVDGSAIDEDLHGHQSIKSGIGLAKRLAARRTLFTHIGHVKVAHRDLDARVAREGGEGFGLAHDGLTVEV